MPYIFTLTRIVTHDWRMKTICETGAFMKKILKRAVNRTEAGIAQSVQRRATGWTVWVRFTSGVKEFSLQCPDRSGVHPAGFFPGRQSGRGMKLTNYLNLMPRSRMEELYLHSFTRLQGMVLKYLSTWTTSLLTLNRRSFLISLSHCLLNITERRGRCVQRMD
jgi:hypothetical protein